MKTTTGEETLKNCPFCGSYHGGTCPLVEEIEYYENGTIKRVKFKSPSHGIKQEPQGAIDAIRDKFWDLI